MKKNYLRITKEQAEGLGLLGLRQETNDGGILICVKDLAAYGDMTMTLEGKVADLKSELLTDSEAVKLLQK